MRHLTFAAVALATVVASGAAFAADEPSRAAADAAARAAAVQSQPQALGYAPRADHPAFMVFAAAPERSSVSEADRLFLKQGDRGLGNN